ncbi:MAG: Na(+)-translocating NADH-quinone reductase subunit A [Pirellulaceae bacterium]
MVHSITRGLDVPIAGQPVQTIATGPGVSSVGLIGDDYVGMRPRMLVREGDKVKLGQPLFEDKKTEGVIYTSPGAGTVQSVDRGAKRKFESIAIALEGDESETFRSYDSLDELTQEEARELLVMSGEWTALRTRPFSRVPATDSEASSIFVTAMDTNPLAPEAELVISQHKEAFVAGLQVVTKINSGEVYVCTKQDSRVPGKEIRGARFESFAGPHPAGLAGTHIHMLDPVSMSKVVWTIGYQDVIAWGHLFLSGKLLMERTVAIAGPVVRNPQLYTTRRGANLLDLTQGNIVSDNFRIISGSVLHGRAANEPVQYLGRYHNQVTVLEEGNTREFLGWQKPGGDKFSITRAYLGSWLKGKRFNMNTNINGGYRTMVPIGGYERVMPLDIVPTFLLRALITRDTDRAQQLGCLELDEEDLGLCTFVCPGKYEYGTILRDNLSQIEKEG